MIDSARLRMIRLSIGNQLAIESYQGITDPVRLKFVLRPHSDECSYNLFGFGYTGLGFPA